MTDFSADTPSTVIDTDAGPSAAGGGAPVVAPEADTSSIRSDLEAVFKEEAKEPAKVDLKAETPKEPDKAKEAEPVKDAPAKDAPKEEDGKATRDQSGKFTAKAPAEGNAEEKPEGEAAQRNDDRRYPEAPKSFLPQAKEVWRNVPRAVQAEVERMARDHETASEQYKANNDRYEEVREFDELARTNGRDLRQSLSKMVEIEKALTANPIAGLNAVLMEVGPRKADGQPYSLYEVAQFVAQQGPQGYQQMMAQANSRPANQQQPNAELQEVRAQLAELQQRQQMQQASAIIEPFAASHPRYGELQEDIAFFLNSGKIPTSLSPSERLAAAYDMAERINPPSHGFASERQDGPDLQDNRRADDGFSGSRSIKSSPGSVTESVETEAKGGESTRDSLLAEMRRLNRA